MAKRRLIVYTDGGARGNPGPAAAGVVIFNQEKKVLWEKGYYLGRLTNNQAEYRGLILGLQKARDLQAGELTFFMDSELVVKQIRGEYRVKNEKLKPLFQQASRLLEHFSKVVLQHTYRAGNKKADKLVNDILDHHKK